MKPVSVDADYNEPAYVARNLEKIAELREADPEELAETTTRNAEELFLPE